ncbi:HD-GYP domain-containing protein [Clostridium niameyense]|uniref:HD-GYP domain-containing protein n=1 Tax=Clostridium niameyense TaxID=1622073 RepID=A0A6M0RAF3_9CLOT|nr:HD-GYP domain-containing protein [Clostridium niameyense]NEZ47202.1 HD-GYP domain-containing protein [Clostridium niameyense]
MRLEFINRVKPGDVLGRNIFSEKGQVLLKSGIKLTQGYINKLRNLGVLYVYVEDARLEDVVVEDEKLMKLKQTTMKSMANITKNVHDFNGKKLKDSFNEVEEMINYIINMGDVNKSLYDIKTYDNYTYVHSLDTCIMTAFLGMSSGLNELELKEISIGAILHDIGKIKIPNNIINKKGKLTDEEFEEIKKHPIYGREMLVKNLAISNNIIKIVEQHHERIDGNGYPYGLKGSQICKNAKIVCICDVYDAVSNDRCYRKKFTPNDAYELILSGSGVMFDEELVRNFKNTFAIYPLGCRVKLSNGETGYVIRQNRGLPDRPVVRIFYDSLNKSNNSYYEMDLLNNPNIVIECVAL